MFPHGGTATSLAMAAPARDPRWRGASDARAHTGEGCGGRWGRCVCAPQTCAHSDVALAMLSNPEIKRVLVHLADDDTDLAFGDGTVGGGDGGGDGCGSGGGLGDGSAGPRDGMITAPLDAQWALSLCFFQP